MAAKERILLQKLITLGVFRRKRVVLRSGEVSDFYCDIKMAYGNPELLNMLADAVGKLLPRGVSAVAASGYGGLPLAAVVAARFGKKFIAVREKPKSHGLGGWIDGYKPKRADKVAIIDDVLTSGSSIRATHMPLKRAGVKIVAAIVVLRRGEVRLPFPVHSVFTPPEIMKMPLK